MKEAFLRCRYMEGGIAFLGEYMIKLNTEKGEKNWCIINKEDLIKQDNENGLVKVISEPSNKKGNILVAINDVGDHRISTFSVPETEIVDID
ncbi:MAG: hypothetical protein V1660_02315 [archaeon]